MDVLVTNQMNAIARARVALKELQESTFDKSTKGSTSDAYSFGKLAEATEHAEEALFNVLNIASSHFDDYRAKLAIQNGLDHV